MRLLKTPLNTSVAKPKNLNPNAEPEQDPCLLERVRESEPTCFRPEAGQKAPPSSCLHVGHLPRCTSRLIERAML